MTNQWSDLVGSLVGGKYQLTEYLGDVGDNGVFATDGSHGAAIVRLAPEPTAEKLLERWSAAVRVTHPAIIRILDAGRAEVGGKSFVYTVTERPDDSLAEAVRARALTGDEARDVVKSILSAVAYLHEQGFAHGSIDVDNIVAVGDHIKLGPWTIQRGDDTAKADDMFATGQTIVEILTQKRPATDVEANVAALPAPFGVIARAALQRRTTATGALETLEAREVAPAHAPPVRMKVPMAAIAMGLVAVVVLLFGVRSYQSETQSETPAPKAAAVASRSADPVVRERSVSPAATVVPAPSQPQPESAWVLVAAIYKDYDLAAKRAQSIAQKWTQWQPEVYPPAGQGKRRYMVLLQRAETRKEAERLLARARSEGMPRDTYVTEDLPLGDRLLALARPRVGAEGDAIDHTIGVIADE